MERRLNMLLEIDHVTKYFMYDYLHPPVLQNLNFSVKKGEFVAIMGSSGSGKSTLFSLLLGESSVSEGSIRFDGTDITEYSHRQWAYLKQKKLGSIYQDFALFPTLTVEENLWIPQGLYTEKHQNLVEHITYFTKKFMIDHLLDQPAYTLSKGEQQKVVIIRSLLQHPELILADEPTSFLDGKSTVQVLKEFKKQNQKGISILMATHDVFAASYCSRVCFLQQGKIIAEIYQGESQKEFLDRIVQMQITMGGSIFDEWL